MATRGASDSDVISEFSETSWEEHKSLMKIYTLSSSSSSLLRSKIAPSDLAVLHSRHQFVRDDEADAKECSSWEVRMARKYYNLLYKEYAIADLSRFTEGKIGLRWRMEKEVIGGKGQFTCGATNCDSSDELHSYELPFQYVEDGKRKSELVKVRVCKECAVKLFYKNVKEKETERKKRIGNLESKTGRKRDRREDGGNKNRDDVESVDRIWKGNDDTVVCSNSDIACDNGKRLKP